MTKKHFVLRDPESGSTLAVLAVDAGDVKQLNFKIGKACEEDDYEYPEELDFFPSRDTDVSGDGFRLELIPTSLI